MAQATTQRAPFESESAEPQMMGALIWRNGAWHPSDFDDVKEGDLFVLTSPDDGREVGGLSVATEDAHAEPSPTYGRIRATQVATMDCEQFGELLRGLTKKQVDIIEALSRHIIETERDQHGNPDEESGRAWVDAIKADAKPKERPAEPLTRWRVNAASCYPNGQVHGRRKPGAGTYLCGKTHTTLDANVTHDPGQRVECKACLRALHGSLTGAAAIKSAIEATGADAVLVGNLSAEIKADPMRCNLCGGMLAIPSSHGPGRCIAAPA